VRRVSSVGVKTATERELAEALRERLRIIADGNSRRDPDAHMQRLREISARIDSLARSLPRPINAQLAHYLSRHSYEKALAVLERRLP